MRGKVTYGIHPEHLQQVEVGQNGAGPDCTLTAVVAVVEPTGSETYVMLRHNGLDLVAVFTNRVAFTPGATITLAQNRASSHLFHKSNGQRT